MLTSSNSKPNLRYKENKPLAIVNLGEGLSITIYPQDDITNLVQQFCIQNRIDLSLITSIVQAIEEQINIKRTQQPSIQKAPTFGGMDDLLESFGNPKNYYQYSEISNKTTNQSLSDKQDNDSHNDSKQQQNTDQSIFDKLYTNGVQHYKQRQQIQQLNKQQKIDQELQNATFKPTISQKSKIIAQNRIPQHIISRKATEPSFSFRPILSPNTERIVQRSKSRSNTPIHQKLYAEGLQVGALKQQWVTEQQEKRLPGKCKIAQNKVQTPRNKGISPLNQQSSPMFQRHTPSISKSPVNRVQSDVVAKLLQSPKINDQQLVDKSTGRPFFKPYIQKDKFFESVSRKVDESDLQLAKCISQQHFSKVQLTSQPNEILMPKKIIQGDFDRAVNKVFSCLDEDGDGMISAQKLDLSKIDGNVLEIIAEVLYEMEDQQKILQLDQFKQMCQKHGLQQKLIKQTAFPEPKGPFKKLF